MFDIDVKTILNGSIASTTALICELPFGRQSKILETFKSLANKSCGNMMRMHAHAQLLHMKEVVKLCNVFDIEVGSIWNGLVASTSAL
jgi:hypothetical protein